MILNKNTFIVMIKITLCFIVLFFSENLLAQKDTVKRNLDLAFEITVRSSSGQFYYNKVQLQSEGLFLFHLIEKKNRCIKSKIKFIPIKKVVKYLPLGIEIIDLFNFIEENKIMNINGLNEPDLSCIEHRNKISIICFNIISGESTYFEYGYYDESIDTLINIINNIVPKKFRREFSIKKNSIPDRPCDK